MKLIFIVFLFLLGSCTTISLDNGVVSIVNNRYLSLKKMVSENCKPQSHLRENYRLVSSISMTQNERLIGAEAQTFNANVVTYYYFKANISTRHVGDKTIITAGPQKVIVKYWKCPQKFIDEEL